MSCDLTIVKAYDSPMVFFLVGYSGGWDRSEQGREEVGGRGWEGGALEGEREPPRKGARTDVGTGEKDRCRNRQGARTDVHQLGAPF